MQLSWGCWFYNNGYELYTASTVAVVCRPNFISTTSSVKDRIPIPTDAIPEINGTKTAADLPIPNEIPRVPAKIKKNAKPYLVHKMPNLQTTVFNRSYAANAIMPKMIR